MSELKRLLIEDKGKVLEIYVESPQTPPTTEPANTGKRPGEKGATDDVLLKMAEVQEKIQAGSAPKVRIAETLYRRQFHRLAAI